MPSDSSRTTGIPSIICALGSHEAANREAEPMLPRSPLQGSVRLWRHPGYTVQNRIGKSNRLGPYPHNLQSEVVIRHFAFAGRVSVIRLVVPRPEPITFPRFVYSGRDMGTRD